MENWRLENEFIYGRNPVIEVIENSSLQVNKVWLSNGLQDTALKAKVIDFAKLNKIPFRIVPIKKLNQLTNNKNHQGLVFSISPIKYSSVQEIINSDRSKVVLVAHEIQDPHNLGAIIRTFIAGGGKSIIITGKSSIGINSTIIKTSAGALFQAGFARATNCINVLHKLKDNGYSIFGTDNSESSVSLYEINVEEKVAILIGNEHEGLGQLIRKNCDCLIKIPISNKVDSLNVSVAFGIVLFEILRRNREQKV